MLSLLKCEKQNSKQKRSIYRVKCYTEDEASFKVKVEEKENNSI